MKEIQVIYSRKLDSQQITQQILLTIFRYDLLNQ